MKGQAALLCLLALFSSKSFIVVVAALEQTTTHHDDKINDMEGEELRTFHMPGVILHKTKEPLEKGYVGKDFPGSTPAHLIRKAYGIEVVETHGGRRRMELERNNTKSNDACSSSSSSPSSDNDDQTCNLEWEFGSALLSTARRMFVDRGLEDELNFFIEHGVSNPDAGSEPRRMHWAALEILPNQSLALHSHPNVEFAYIVEGVMHEFRMNPNVIDKKKVYAPEEIVTTSSNDNSQIQKKSWKYTGPDLSTVDASKAETFHHNMYREGDMFINTIGDVHQSFTKDEGVKLFVMWGDGNADVPENEYPKHSEFLNRQSAQAWN